MNFNKHEIQNYVDNEHSIESQNYLVLRVIIHCKRI